MSQSNVLSAYPLVVTVDNALDSNECDSLISLSERIGFEEAPVTINGQQGIFQMMPDVRNNTRVIFDNVELAERLFERVKQFLPDPYKGWLLEGLNERFRFYRYEPGQVFKPHEDGRYRRSVDCQSKLTLLFYLSEDCVGGETAFFGETDSEVRLKVNPVKGQALIFEHRQLHSGEPVLEGVKYVLRTDVMYKR